MFQHLFCSLFSSSFPFLSFVCVCVCVCVCACVVVVVVVVVVVSLNIHVQQNKNKYSGARLVSRKWREDIVFWIFSKEVSNFTDLHTYHEGNHAGSSTYKTRLYHITVQPLPKVKSLPHFLNMFQWVDCSNISWIERLCTKILLSFCRTKKFSPQRLKDL